MTSARYLLSLPFLFLLAAMILIGWAWGKACAFVGSTALQIFGDAALSPSQERGRKMVQHQIDVMQGHCPDCARRTDL